MRCLFIQPDFGELVFHIARTNLALHQLSRMPVASHFNISQQICCIHFIRYVWEQHVFINAAFLNTMLYKFMSTVKHLPCRTSEAVRRFAAVFSHQRKKKTQQNKCNCTKMFLLHGWGHLKWSFQICNCSHRVPRCRR